MSRKFLIGISIFIVVILAFYFGLFAQKSQKNDIYTQLQPLSGFDRGQVKGHYFVLHFWAKWCAPCAEEIPHLVAFSRLAEEKLGGLKVLAVSLDESLELSKSILPDQGAHLPGNFLLFLDVQHAVAETLGSYQYPETYFYDPVGRIVEKWVGPQKWDSPEVFDYFRQKMLTNP